MSDKELPESFANYPTSIAEKKASNTPQGADLWKPRDALIACLRAIDAGEIDPDYLIISAASVNKKHDNDTSFNYFQCIPNTFYGVGMLQAGIFDYLAGQGA